MSKDMKAVARARPGRAARPCASRPFVERGYVRTDDEQHTRRTRWHGGMLAPARKRPAARDEWTGPCVDASRLETGCAKGSIDHDRECLERRNVQVLHCIRMEKAVE